MPRSIPLLLKKINAFTCKGLCHQSCTRVPISREEASILGIDGLFTPPHENDPTDCSFLTENKQCSVYENRPFICRLYGATSLPRLKCPWGCSPVITTEEGHLLTEHYLETQTLPSKTEMAAMLHKVLEAAHA